MGSRARTLLVLALAGACRSTPDVPAATEEDGSPLSGTLTTRYRGRTGEDDEDHDLYQAIDLSYAPAIGAWRAHVFGQLFWDLDGSDRDGPFFGLQDTRDDELTGRLYQAFVDLEQVEELPFLRVGRQELYDAPVFLYFDGVRAETGSMGAARARIGAYAGVPTHPWESSSSGDVLAGLRAEVDLWEDARLRLEWMHLEDERLTVPHEDDLFGLTLTQEIGGERRATHLSAAVTALEGEERDLRVAASHHDAERELSVDVDWYELFETQTELAVPLDPFYSTLFELFPYRLLGLSTAKSWEHFELRGGILLRRVDDAGDVGDFNRDYERYSLGASTDDLLPLGATLGLTGELWESQRDEIRTWGLDVSREIEERWLASLGSYYSLFKYDYVSGAERDDVRTWYLDVRFRRTRTTRWTLRYEYEDANLEEVHGLRLGFSWSF